MWSKEFQNYVNHFWSLRRELLLDRAGEVLAQIEKTLDGCGEEEELLLRYLLATLPLSDLGDYEPELLLKFVREALKVREEFSWCRKLPEHLFLLWVLYPRINTERLEDCRGLFREQLAKRVKGLSVEEAALEVNRWCAENATYRSTDECTASALAVYRRGYGRCGEESVFAVNALRSVGIAARQVYAPWWSHCDDNHAWVEVWDGARWRYLGACEPEPELDRGWFTSAASRAVMVHARAFLQGGEKDWAFLFPDSLPVDLAQDHGMVLENVTRHYAETKLITVTVKNSRGDPVPGVRVAASVLNMASFHEAAARKTEQNGTACFCLGKGSVLLSAFSDKTFGEAFADIREQSEFDLVLKEHDSFETEVQDFDFFAPSGDPGYPKPLSQPQKQKRREVLDRCAVLREERQRHLKKPSPLALTLEQQPVWETLTEKDRAGEPDLAVLDDSREAFQWEKDFLPEVFSSALLCPRIGLEPLLPWREALRAAFSPKEQEEFRADPQRIWLWVEQHVLEEKAYSDLWVSPVGAFRLRAAGPKEKKALFCALCRAFGVPARLSAVESEPEFWLDGDFHRLTAEREGTVCLRGPEKTSGLNGQNFSLSHFGPNGWEALRLSDIPAGEERVFTVSSGLYRLITSTRLPNGNQLARETDFFLAEGAEKALSLSFREGGTADLLEHIALPPFLLKDRGGEVRESTALFKERPFSLVFWLEPGREPTEHILNELREAGAALAETGCGLHMILDSFEREQDSTLQSALPHLPGAVLWQGDFQDTAPALARRVFTDPEKLPLVLLTNSKAESLYSCAGYNVGTAELLIRLLRELDK